MNVEPDLLADIINEGPSVAFVWHLVDDWPVTYVSENVKQFGYTSKQFMTGEVRFDDIVHTEDMERVKREVEQHLKSGTEKLSQNYRIVTRDGDIRTISDWSHTIRDSNGDAIYLRGIVIDITDTISIVERSNLYLDTAETLFVRLDATGKVMQVNQKTESVIGLPASEIIGTDWIQRFVPEYELSGVIKEFSRSLETDGVGKSGEYENDIVTEKGEHRHIRWRFTQEMDQAGRLESLLAFGLDITDELDTQKRNRVLTDFERLSPTPLMRLDRSGDVQYANDMALALIEQLTRCPASQVKAWQKKLEVAAKMTYPGEFMAEIEDQYFLFKSIPDDDHVNIYGMDITREYEGETKISIIAASLPGALFEFTIHDDGRESIVFSNDRCQELWEVSADALQNNPSQLWEMILPADFKAMRDSVLKSREDLSAWQHEWRIKTPSGKEKWLQGSAIPIRKGNGDTYWNTIVLEVTEAKRASEQRAEALSKTVHALSAVLEARDPYTDGHEQRVASIAVSIAKHMGFEQERIKGLELAATIHDLGKINVPAEILSKPTKLSELEFSLIKTHATAGADFIKDIDFDWPVSDIIRQHHERLDGSGYPDGLKGDEILMEARILGVADTLEAMFSHRPYRAGLGLEAAANELRRGRGKIYDATAVDTALHLIDTGEIELTL